MNSQPAWWKSGRWNNPALLSRVVSGKRRFSIFSRRTGKRGAEFPKGSFPTHLHSCFQPLSGDISVFPGKGNSLITPATFQNRDTAALTASFRFYRCGSSPPYPAKPIREGPLLGKLHLHMRAASKIPRPDFHSQRFMSRPHLFGPFLPAFNLAKLLN